VKELTKIVIVAIVGVIVLDALTSVASRTIGFPYSLAGVVTIAIYCATGFYATRYANLKVGLLASAIVGFVDSTVGWAISWIIGPGRPEGKTTATGGLVLTIASVILVATISGLFGGILSKILSSFGRSTG
jgi:hypothetical protein